MSNDDSTPPNAPRDDSETGLGRLGQDPTQGDDETAVFEAPVRGEQAAPGGGVPTDATQVMPTTPTRPLLPSENPGAVGGAVPPGAPMSATGPNTSTDPYGGPPPEWYRQPGLVAGVLLGLVAIGALVVFLFIFDGDDGDVLVDGDVEAVTLSVTRIDANGNPLTTTIAAEVTTVDSSPFTWISPDGVAEGEPGRIPTDGEGRAEFRWVPVGDDAGGFESSVVLREFVAGVPDGGAPVESIAAACTIETDDRADSLAVDASLTADPANDSTTRAGEYSFPNATFGPGDRIECTFRDVGPGTPPPTTVPTESSTVPETTLVEATTTIPPTTVPETTVPETTTTSTTTTSTTTTTTTTTTTLPPEPPPSSLGDVLRRDPELSQSLALLTRVGLLDDLEDENQPFTLFVPDNDAIDALRDSADAPDLDDDDVVRAILEVHLSRGQAYTSEQIATVSEIPVEIGRPQPVDGEAVPPTIGDVPIIGLDLEVDGGVVHVLDGIIERL